MSDYHSGGPWTGEYVKRIKISSTVTSIGAHAFDDCDSIEGVYIDDVSSWCSMNFGDSPLYGTNLYVNNELMTELTIPASVTSIPANAFYGCTSLVSVTFAEDSNLESIGNYAFYNTVLTSITIPSGVTSIGTSAFASCDYLVSVTFAEGSKLESIGSNAFGSCYRLVEVINNSSLDIEKGSSTYGGVAKYALDVYTGESKVTHKNDFLFYTYKGVHYLLGYKGDKTNLVLPESFNDENYAINQYAFYWCYSLESITLPSNLIEIGRSAFSGCDSLVFNNYGNAKYLGNETNPYLALIQSDSTSITTCTIHEDTRIISSNAFSSCTKLTSITIPSGVTSIGDSAFDSCRALTNIIFDEGSKLESIGDSAFSNCDLTSITIPSGVTSIGDSAFSNCDLTSIKIPSSVTSIGADAFQFYGSMDVYIDDIYSWCNIEFGNAYSHPLNRSSTNLYLDGELITELVIPEGVTRIPGYSFSGQKTITSVKIPSTVTSIGAYAFSGCSSLASATLDEGSKLQSIGSYAFSGCSSLASATLDEGSKLQSIGSYAFSSCSKLTSITIPSGVTSIGAYAFSGTALESITIPAGVTSIGAHAFDNCNSLKSVIFDEGSDLESIGSYAFDSCSKLASITIPSGVRSIGDFAFSDCDLLKSVMFEEGSKLQSIGEYAFYNCESLASITIPSSVTSIGNSAFYDCSLYSVTFEEGSKLQSIGEYAFYSTDSASITIPSSVTSIGDHAFDNCNSLKSVIFDEGSKLQSIGEYAFDGCYRLASITIPASVTSIGAHAFYYCYELRNIIFDEGSKLESIGDAAFCRCYRLESITIPSGVTSIGNHAFLECSSLRNVYFDEGSKLQSIGNYTFSECDRLTTIKITSGVTSIGSGALYESGNLSRVYYEGTSNDWQQISIGDDNDLLLNTSRTYICTSHTYGDWETQDPDCDTNGSKRKVCSTCYDVQYKVIGALGHSFVNYISNNNATCTADGTKTATCERCTETSTVMDKTQPKLSHDMSVATCTEASKCRRDGCNYTEGTELGHDFADYVSNNNATCTEDGTKTAVCERCTATDTITETGTKINHNFVDYIADNNATCTADGTKTAICELCTATDTIPVAGTVLGHNYSSVVTAPTCTTEGYTTHTCSRCNDSYTDTETTKLSHDMSRATCTEVSRCQRTGCNYTEGIALGHSWDTGVVEKEPTHDEVGKQLFTCTVCLDTKTEDIPKLSGVVGDVDGNSEITSSDAIYLLMHTFYPEDYPVEQESDFNGDGNTNSSDAIYLLMYTFYPEDYPLMHNLQTPAILTNRKKED